MRFFGGLSPVLLFLMTFPAQGAGTEPKDREERPLPEDQVAAIAANSALVQKQMGAATHIDFNYTIESIKWLDAFIETTRVHRTDSKLADVVGAYLGETIRVRYACAWVDFRGAFALRCPEGVVLFPMAKTAKQFANGHEDSVYSFYLAIPQLISAAARESTQGNDADK
jgi:hypothetical protein